MLNTEDKRLVALEATKILETKIQSIHHELHELSEGLQNDTKSSAGDKHETSRAMNQLEQEKLQHQLAELLRQKEILTQINLSVHHFQITSGSLFETDKAIFYLCIPIGRINAPKGEILVISPQSPIGKTFLGRKTGDTVEYNNTIYRIIDIA